MATTETLWRQVHNLAEQFAALGALRDALQEPINLEAEVAKLTDDARELAMVIGERQEVLRKLERTIESADARLADAQAVVAEAEAMAAPIRAEQRRLEAERERLAKEVAGLERKAKDWEATHAQLVSTGLARVKELDADIAQRGARLQQITDAIAATKQAAARL